MNREGRPPETPIAKLRRLLENKVASKDFSLEEGQTEEQVLKRAELLGAALENLSSLVSEVLTLYRRSLEDKGITKERTGALSVFVVGGRAHNESHLKAYSDIDLIITAEHPLRPAEYHPVAKTFLEAFEGTTLEEFGRLLSAKLNRPVNLTDTEGADGGLIQVKGFGYQNPTEVEGGIRVGGK